MNARDELIEIVTSSPEWSGGDVVWSTGLIDAHRSEVLAEADLLPKADVVAWLTKKAREDTPVWQLASKADRGAIRPDNLRMLPPDFFEPDHAYTHRDGTDFVCVAVTAHPQTGERLAMGWHVDSWDLHYPATVGINQWNHEYDGAQAPASTPEVAS